MQTIGELGIKIVVEAGGVDKKISKITKTSTKASQGLTKLANVFGGVLKKAIIGATVALGAFTASATMVGAAFEKEVAILGSIRGISKATAQGAKELEQFETKARQLGATTAFSASEAVIGMQQLARAGLTANQTISAIGPALLFAGANASSMEQATSLLASTMKQFSLSADNASRITDAFTIIQQQSLFDMESLTNAMRFAGIVGNSFGMSIEETTAAVAMFRDLGLQGSQAGTQFRMAMMKLAKPTEKAKKVFKDLNIDLKDVNPELVSFDKIVKRLSTTNMTFADVSTIFGTRAAGAMKTIIEQFATGEEKYSQFIKAIEEGGGTTAKTYEATLNNLSGFTDIAKSAFQELQLSTYELFAGPLMELVGGSDGTGGITGLFNTITETISVASSTISNNLGQSLTGLYTLVNENQGEIAAKIVVLIEQITFLAVKFVELIPTIIKITKFLTFLFASATLVSFTSKIALLIGKMSTMGGMLGALAIKAKAFGAALALSNPAGWAVALGVAVTSMIAFSMATSDAEKRQQMLADSVDYTRQKMEEQQQENKDTAKDFETDAKIRVGALKTVLDKRGELSKALENELDNVARMKGATLEQAIATGAVTKAVIHNQEVLLSQRAIELLQIDTKEQYNYLIQDQIDRQEELNQAHQEETDKLTRLTDLQDYLTGLQKQVADGTMSQKTASLLAAGATKKFSDVQDKLRGSAINLTNQMNAVLVVLNAQKELYAQTGKEAEDYANAVAEAETLIAQQEERERIKKQREREREAKLRREKASDEAKKRAKDIVSEQKKLVQLREKLGRDLQRVDDTYSEQVIAKADDEVASITKQYDKLFKLLKKQGRSTAQAEEELATTILIRRSLSLQKYSKEYEETQNKIINEAKRSQMTEVELNEQATKDQIELENERAKAKIGLLKEETQAQIESYKKQIALQLKQAKTQQERDQILQEADENILFEMEFLEEKKQEVIDASNKVIGVITQNGANKRLEIEKQLQDQITAIQSKGRQLSAIEQVKADQKVALEKYKAQTKNEELIQAFILAQRQELQQVEQGVLDQFVNLYGQYSDEVNAIDKQIFNRRFNFGVESLNAQKDFLIQLSELEKELADVRAQTVGLSAENRLKAEQNVQNKIQKLYKDNKIFSLKGIKDQTRGFLDNIKGFFGRFKNIGKQGLKGNFIDKLKQGFKGLDKATNKIKVIFVIKKIVGALKKAFRFIQTFTKGLIKSIKQVSKLLKQGFDFITGGVNLNPFEAISGGASKLVEAQKEAIKQQEELENRLKSGEITKEEFDTEMARIQESVDPKKVANDFVDEIIDNAINMVEAVAKVAPIILQRLAERLPDLFNALEKNIPILLQGISENLPKFTTALVNGIIKVLPILVDALEKVLPVLAEGTIKIIGELLPQLLRILQPLMIQLVNIFAENTPLIVQAVLKALPEILDFITIAVIATVKAMVNTVTNLIKGILKGLNPFSDDSDESSDDPSAFRDAVKELFTLGFGKTETFGDTPYAIKAGMRRMRAQFAPNDYIIASKTTSGLLAQAVQAFNKNSGISKNNFVPTNNERRSGGDINLSVSADGRLLDAVTISALNRGHAPKLEKRLTRRTGARVGFDRGRFNFYGG